MHRLDVGGVRQSGYVVNYRLADAGRQQLYRTGDDGAVIVGWVICLRALNSTTIPCPSSRRAVTRISPR